MNDLDRFNSFKFSNYEPSPHPDEGNVELIRIERALNRLSDGLMEIVEVLEDIKRKIT